MRQACEARLLVSRWRCQCVHLPLVATALATALAAALAPLPVGGNVASGCSIEASSKLADMVADDPSSASTAGCAAANPGSICDIIGTDGPCENNPACPENQIENLGCTPDNAATGCCFQEIVVPCPACMAITISCKSMCDGDIMPITTAEARDAQCADLADLALPRIAQGSVGAVESCQGSQDLQFCDAVGRAGVCPLEPLCDGLPGGEDHCQRADTACCYVMYSRPCSSCEPVPQACLSQCDLLDPPNAAVATAAPFATTVFVKPAASRPSNEPSADQPAFTPLFVASPDVPASGDEAASVEGVSMAPERAQVPVAAAAMATEDDAHAASAPPVVTPPEDAGGVASADDPAAGAASSSLPEPTISAAPAEGLQSDDLDGPAGATGNWGDVLAPPANNVGGGIPADLPEDEARDESREHGLGILTDSSCPGAGLVGGVVAMVCWTALAIVVVVA